MSEYEVKDLIRERNELAGMVVKLNIMMSLNAMIIDNYEMMLKSNHKNLPSKLKALSYMGNT